MFCTFAGMTSLTLNSKLCNFITLWNLTKTLQNFVQSSFSIKLRKICHKDSFGHRSPLKNSVFNCKNYIQIKGCAMGTICAPSYANIFMDHFETKYLSPFLRELSLRILTGKKQPKIKLQRSRKIQIWSFGLLVHHIISFWEVLKLEKFSPKTK